MKSKTYREFKFSKKFKQVILDPNDLKIKKQIEDTIKEQERTLALKNIDKETLEIVINI